MTDPEFDAEQRRQLGAYFTAANLIEQSVTGQLQSGQPVPTKALLQQLSSYLQECQIVVEQHAEGTVKVGSEVLLDLAKALGAIHVAMDAVALVPPDRVQS